MIGLFRPLKAKFGLVRGGRHPYPRPKVIFGVRFTDGIEVRQEAQAAACLIPSVTNI